jgi:hypothetical protein
MTINVARCAHEIISRIAMTKAAFTRRRLFSLQEIGHKLRK